MGAGRLLLFIGRNYEADNADDDKRVLKQFTVCYHWAAPLSKVRGQEAAPVEGTPAYRAIGSAEKTIAQLMTKSNIKRRPAQKVYAAAVCRPSGDSVYVLLPIVEKARIFSLAFPVAPCKMNLPCNSIVLSRLPFCSVLLGFAHYILFL